MRADTQRSIHIGRRAAPAIGYDRDHDGTRNRLNNVEVVARTGAIAINASKQNFSRTGLSHSDGPFNGVDFGIVNAITSVDMTSENIDGGNDGLGTELA